MVRPLLLAALLFLAAAPDSGAEGRILFYDFCAGLDPCGYESDHYDDDLLELLSAAGYDVDLVDRSAGRIDAALLDPYDQVWLLAANNNNVLVVPVEPEEVAAVTEFSAAGGGVAIFGEHDDFFGSVNDFAVALGGRFTTTGIDRVVGNGMPTSGFPDHPLWKWTEALGGAASEGAVQLVGGSSLEIVAEYPPGQGMVAAGEPFGGRVVLDGSFVRTFDAEWSPPFSTSATQFDNEVYLTNLAGWLAPGGPISTERCTWGSAKARYR
jgi:hypothetical protein